MCDLGISLDTRVFVRYQLRNHYVDTSGCIIANTQTSEETSFISLFAEGAAMFEPTASEKYQQTAHVTTKRSGIR